MTPNQVLGIFQGTTIDIYVHYIHILEILFIAPVMMMA